MPARGDRRPVRGPPGNPEKESRSLLRVLLAPARGRQSRTTRRLLPRATFRRPGSCRFSSTSGITNPALGGSSWYCETSPPSPGSATEASATPPGSVTTCRYSRTPMSSAWSPIRTRSPLTSVSCVTIGGFTLSATLATWLYRPTSRIFPRIRPNTGPNWPSTGCCSAGCPNPTGSSPICVSPPGCPPADTICGLMTRWRAGTTPRLLSTR